MGVCPPQRYRSESHVIMLDQRSQRLAMEETIARYRSMVRWLTVALIIVAVLLAIACGIADHEAALIRGYVQIVGATL